MKRWQIILGIILIVLGLIALIEAIFEINLGRFIGPMILIGLGLWLILRPQIVGPNVHVQMPILGDVRKTGTWEATDHEIWMLVGSNRLDFTEAVFPKGEATVKIFGMVAEVTIILPEDVGLAVGSTAFVSEFKSFEGKQERILSPLTFQSSNYEEVDKRVRVQTLGFVSDIKVRPSLI